MNPVLANYGVTNSTLPNRHEITTAFLTLGQPSADTSGHWLTVWNGESNQFARIGWNSTTDGLGNQWQTPQEAMSSLQFGNPGTSPYNNNVFNAYFGDLVWRP